MPLFKKKSKNGMMQNPEHDRIVDIYHEDAAERPGSVAEAIRQKMAKGGEVDDGMDYDDMNEIVDMGALGPDGNDPETDDGLKQDEDETQMDMVSRIRKKMRMK